MSEPKEILMDFSISLEKIQPLPKELRGAQLRIEWKKGRRIGNKSGSTKLMCPEDPLSEDLKVDWNISFKMRITPDKPKKVMFALQIAQKKLGPHVWHTLGVGDINIAEYVKSSSQITTTLPLKDPKTKKSLKEDINLVLTISSKRRCQKRSTGESSTEFESTTEDPSESDISGSLCRRHSTTESEEDPPRTTKLSTRSTPSNSISRLSEWKSAHPAPYDPSSESHRPRTTDSPRRSKISLPFIKNEENNNNPDPKKLSLKKKTTTGKKQSVPVVNIHYSDENSAEMEKNFGNSLSEDIPDSGRNIPDSGRNIPDSGRKLSDGILPPVRLEKSSPELKNFPEEELGSQLFGEPPKKAKSKPEKKNRNDETNLLQRIKQKREGHKMHSRENSGEIRPGKYINRRRAASSSHDTSAPDEDQGPPPPVYFVPPPVPSQSINQISSSLPTQCPTISVEVPTVTEARSRFPRLSKKKPKLNENGKQQKKKQRTFQRSQEETDQISQRGSSPLRNSIPSEKRTSTDISVPKLGAVTNRNSEKSEKRTSTDISAPKLGAVTERNSKSSEKRTATETKVTSVTKRNSEKSEKRMSAPKLTSVNKRNSEKSEKRTTPTTTDTKLTAVTEKIESDTLLVRNRSDGSSERNLNSDRNILEVTSGSDEILFVGEEGRKGVTDARDHLMDEKMDGDSSEGEGADSRENQELRETQEPINYDSSDYEVEEGGPPEPGDSDIYSDIEDKRKFSLGKFKQFPGFRKDSDDGKNNPTSPSSNRRALSFMDDLLGDDQKKPKKYSGNMVQQMLKAPKKVAVKLSPTTQYKSENYFKKFPSGGDKMPDIESDVELKSSENMTLPDSAVLGDMVEEEGENNRFDNILNSMKSLTFKPMSHVQSKLNLGHTKRLTDELEVLRETNDNLLAQNDELELKIEQMRLLGSNEKLLRKIEKLSRRNEELTEKLEEAERNFQESKKVAEVILRKDAEISEMRERLVRSEEHHEEILNQKEMDLLQSNTKLHSYKKKLIQIKKMWERNKIGGSGLGGKQASTTFSMFTEEEEVFFLGGCCVLLFVMAFVCVWIKLGGPVDM